MAREIIRQVSKICSVRWQKYSRCNKRPREEKNEVEQAGWGEGGARRSKVVGNEVKEIRKSQIMRADGTWREQ